MGMMKHLTKLVKALPVSALCDRQIGIAGISVPRSRFLPVKKTSDLLLVMSNLYSLRNGSLVMSPQRMFPTTPLVKLGDNNFSKVSSLTKGSREIHLLCKVKKHRCHEDL
jgi:UDP-N-acetylglucosamine pyrophosphorylase